MQHEIHRLFSTPSTLAGQSVWPPRYAIRRRNHETTLPRPTSAKGGRLRHRTNGDAKLFFIL
jgi:hypothetical protein